MLENLTKGCKRQWREQQDNKTPYLLNHFHSQPRHVVMHTVCVGGRHLVPAPGVATHPDRTSALSLSLSALSFPLRSSFRLIFFFFFFWSPCPPQRYSYRRHLTALFQAYTVYRNHSTLPFQFRPVGCCGVPKRKAIAPFSLHRKVGGREGLKGPEMEEGVFGYLHSRDPC